MGVALGRVESAVGEFVGELVGGFAGELVAGCNVGWFVVGGVGAGAGVAFDAGATKVGVVVPLGSNDCKSESRALPSSTPTASENS